MNASEKHGRGFLHRKQREDGDLRPNFQGKARLSPEILERLSQGGEFVSVAVWEHPHGLSIDIRPWLDPEERSPSE